MDNGIILMLVGLGYVALFSFVIPIMIVKAWLVGIMAILYFAGLISWLSNRAIPLWPKTIVAVSTLLILSLILGVSFVLLPMHKAKQIEDLIANGKRLSTEYVSAEYNFHVRVNFQYPWVIKTSWKDPKTGKTLYFFSRNIWINPEGHVPNTVVVYVDPKDPRKYLMDVSFLKRIED